MNLLLLTAEEAAATPVRLNDERAEHVRKVLRAAVGDVIRVGILDGPLGEGIVRKLAPDLDLECTFESQVSPRGTDTLILAIPRPIVLRRCLAHATALGFGRIFLIRTRHVDKNHLASHALEPDAIQEHVRIGLSQARRTQQPEVQQFHRFKPFVEDSYPELVPEGPQFTADPNADQELTTWARTSPIEKPCTLAIGPERGFTGHELESFAKAGCVPVRTGTHPLRVETALAYVVGQIHAARQLLE